MVQAAKRATLMPIPPVEQHTQVFDAGRISIGVEYRLLSNDIVAKSAQSQGKHLENDANFDDRGVSIHVYVNSDAGVRTERLRFDCFDEGPHYHYVDWSAQSNEIVLMDAVADGDPLAWTLDRIRTRLPHMLARAGVQNSSDGIDLGAIESLLPRVAEAAYRARYEHDDAATLDAALG
jgi:hypothetical protein